jgi:phosphohistidine swiveling domain-containing protein
MNKPIYEKHFSRSFCLAIIETWCKGESTDPRQWTEKQQPRKPFLVFERKDSSVDCYYDPEGIVWIKNELRNKLETDNNFIEKVKEELSKRISNLSIYFEKSTPLNLGELKGFVIKLRNAWVWFEAFWWLIYLLEDENKLEELNKLLKFRKESEEFVPKSDVIIRKSIKNIFPNLDEKYFDVILLKEIFSEQIPNNEILERRLNHYFYTYKTLFENINQKDLEKKYNINLETVKINKDITQLKGDSVYPGKVVGKVRKIMSVNDVHLLKEGEILVSSMTMPDFIVAMDKAKAFVTDEGGILCHVAIVAREMKKPCVIGTKVATKVLNDGDLIEVDADKGVIKILERI